MSPAGESNDAESIGETGSEVVVDVARFAETGEKQNSRPATAPIDDFETDSLASLAWDGYESNPLRRGIDPVGPLGIGATPCRQELRGLLAEGARRRWANAAAVRSSCSVSCTATATRRKTC